MPLKICPKGKKVCHCGKNKQLTYQEFIKRHLSGFKGTQLQYQREFQKVVNKWNKYKKEQ